MRVEVEARPREVPLAPSVMVAEGSAAKRLLRVLVNDPARITSLAGVVHQEGDILLLALLGEEADLPWVEGVSYFGSDPHAPRLRVSTALDVHLEGANPAVALQLLEGALLEAYGPEAMPIVVMPGRVLSLAAARPLDLDVLRTLEARS